MAQSVPEAFDLLFERYLNPLLNFCYYRLGNWEEAEDASQQILVNAFNRLSGFREQPNLGDGSFRAWLFTIAHHEVANRFRNSKRRPSASIEGAALELREQGPELDELLVIGEQQAQVLSWLTLLPSEQQRVLELRLAGLTGPEIAEVLDRSPGSIRVMQSRAIAHLREIVLAGQDNQGGPA